eukprot:TRINITY_DN8384_c0_g1_i4.p1 TRINITY_DN8384_c0_g1~~TRINITY_DN8384_c0_g1_i4.p1  ORF type:complete len:332 (-),score=128.96 TRINITY_DN8384_c0_g1_i4:199-1194(-)
MAVVFPNIDTEQFMWKKSSANEKKLDSELDKFLAKPHTSRMATPAASKIRVEWPTILSSDCSTWLSSRKAESEKKQAEKEKDEENPWLVKGGEKSAIDLARTVREGLIRAGNIKAEDDFKKDSESRIPLPMTEKLIIIEKSEEEVTAASQPPSLSAQVKLGLLRAGSVSLPPPGDKHPVHKQPKPWAPKSLVEGLLRAGGELKKEVVMDNDSVTVEETLEPEVEKESSTVPLESLAETLKKSLMNIKVEKPASPMKTSLSENLRESLLNLSTYDDEESKSESLDNWIMDDNQSEASIITLDTITDSVDMDMEDFDDFNDMEHELSMWISKE